jgi:acetyltransferase-like isoleucine patch superfamily enzyme
MAYLSEEALQKMGFKAVGKNVKISDYASIYNPEMIELEDHSRIDDFCVISGRVSIGKYCHITPMCLVAGGLPGITLSDFCTLAYGVKVFAQSDDYSGSTMVSSLVPKQFKNEYLAEVCLEKQVIVGAGSIIFPGVIIREGCAIGAITLVNRSTQPWAFTLVTRLGELKIESRIYSNWKRNFLKGNQNDSI